MCVFCSLATIGIGGWVLTSKNSSGIEAWLALAVTILSAAAFVGYLCRQPLVARLAVPATLLFSVIGFVWILSDANLLSGSFLVLSILWTAKNVLLASGWSEPVKDIKR